MGKWTRRAVIASGSVVGGGSGARQPAASRWRRTASACGPRPASPGVAQLATWLRITPDGEIVVLVHHCELGQGSQTALAMMLADELDADWSRVRVEEAPGDAGLRQRPHPARLPRWAARPAEGDGSRLRVPHLPRHPPQRLPGHRRQRQRPRHRPSSASSRARRPRDAGGPAAAARWRGAGRRMHCHARLGGERMRQAAVAPATASSPARRRSSPRRCIRRQKTPTEFTHHRHLAPPLRPARQDRRQRDLRHRRARRPACCTRRCAPRRCSAARCSR